MKIDHFFLLKTTSASGYSHTVVSSFEDNEKKDFFGCSDIKKAVYCCESGMLLSEKCFKIDMGYYATDGIPDICNKH